MSEQQYQAEALNELKPKYSQKEQVLNFKFQTNLVIALDIQKSVISSPEHEVLMVSYCGQSMSVVHRASSVVRRQQLL